jgi:hypothetical protein
MSPQADIAAPPTSEPRRASKLRTWRALLFELGVLATGLMIYKFGRTFTRDAYEQARANAQWVIELERTLRIHTERGVQRWVLGEPGWIEVLNVYYVRVHFPATVVLLLWVFVRHSTAYPVVRNWFVGVTLAAVVVHVMFPLAPPRMMAGFVDTLKVYGPQVYHADPRRSVANQFAAMPSLHFGWALMSATIVIALWRSRWSLLVVLHPVVTLFAIVATANHYWLDAVIAAVIAAFVGAVVYVHHRGRLVDDELRRMVDEEDWIDASTTAPV